MVLVKWDEPKHDADVDKVVIYSCTTKTGSFTEVTTLDAQDGDGNWVKEYDHTAGTSTTWYKIKFKNTAGTLGNFSDPLQAGYRPFITIDDFRELTLYGRKEVTDRDFERMRPRAEQAVLDKIAIRVKYEELNGTINSSNTEFTTAHKPIADSDLSHVYDSADVEVFEASTTTTGALSYGTTSVAVSTIQQLDGIVNMSSAPTTNIDDLYANYSYYKKVFDTKTLREAGVYYAAYLLARRNALENPELWLDLFEKTLSR